MKNTIRILNIHISTLPVEKLKQRIFDFVRGKRARLVVTVNPEFLLEALKDDDFKFLLNQSDLAVADGIGIKFIAWTRGHNLSRLTGADTVLELLGLATAEDRPVALLNWEGGLSGNKEIETAVRQKHPSLKFKVFSSDRQGRCDISALRQYKPEIVFSNLGAPHQEKQLFRLKKALRDARLLMGVGGSFDFISGKARRAPRIMRRFGFEWLWRLLIDPVKRIKRIFQAVIVFPLVAFKFQFINPWLYRRNAVGFIYQGDEVLLVNSARENFDYWKLPQGGIESGEDFQQGFLREMKEELGTDDFQIVGRFDKIFKYKWGRKHTINNYKGQKQTLFICEFMGKKNDIRLSPENTDYKWVKISSLLEEVTPVLHKAYKLFLKKYKKIV